MSARSGSADLIAVFENQTTDVATSAAFEQENFRQSGTIFSMLTDNDVRKGRI